jgi:4-carboxymuconolactone decarboxylase
VKRSTGVRPAARAAGRDRLPPIPARRMTAAQREAAREIVASRRRQLSGPFIPSLRSPAFMGRLQKLGEYLRYDSALAPRLREMAILLTAREWTQHYEWLVHAPLARRHGLRAKTIRAIAEGHRPAAMRRDEQILYDFFIELQRTRGVSDETYRRARAQFGERGVIDLAGTVGYYSTLAIIMNVARTPLPPGRPRPLSHFPG